MSEGDREEREALKEKLLDILVERGLFFGGSSGKGLPFVLSTGDPDEPNGYWYYSDKSYTAGKDLKCDCKINDCTWTQRSSRIRIVERARSAKQSLGGVGRLPLRRQCDR